MIVCVLVPRFTLVASLGGNRELLGRPVALAPEMGGRGHVGEVSPAAETAGVVPGMRVGEALARCPELQLVPPDAEAVSTGWGLALDQLESLGAKVESDLPGECYFDAGGLLGLYSGSAENVMAAARHKLGVGRVGASTCRFSARVVALVLGRRRRQSPARRAVVGEREIRGFLAPRPVSLLRARPELGVLPSVLEKLGVKTLGELATMPAHAMSERFGHPGLLALDLANGRDLPLQPRRPPEIVREHLDLPEVASGPQLEHALELLVARLLARPERRGRSLRALVLWARFVEAGGWRRSVVLRAPSADPRRLSTALAPRLAELPAPAEALGLDVEAFGPLATHQPSLLRPDHTPNGQLVARRALIGEAVRQARQAGGEAAALRIIELDAGSRLPERRSVLAPYPAEDL